MKTRICSYCKEEGHFINRCIHPNIAVLQKNIKKDAIIHLYSMIKFNFNFLLYKFNLLTIPELRIIAYRNNLKISNQPNKKEIQDFIRFLIPFFSFQNKNHIYIPYFDNHVLWDYAKDIYRITDNQTTLSIYTDIVKISPRPFCYHIFMELNCTKIHPYLNNDHKCAICLESMLTSDICTMNCKHVFCTDCIKLYLISLYNYGIDDNYYQPNCPLCRTDISTILINDYGSYIYFKSTFSQEFTPNYFNQIDETSITKKHIYEEEFYYNTLQLHDDDLESPYNTHLYIPTDFFILGELRKLLRNHSIIITRGVRIIQQWLFFLGMISIVLLLQNKIQEVYDEIDNTTTHA
tara:strand:+ start:1473 stop:2519 length:1047 start_codon:yes stop_codon:yes gene_type:complete